MPRINGSTVAKKFMCACGRGFAYPGSFKKHREKCSAMKVTGGADVTAGMDALRAELMGHINQLQLDLQASNKRVSDLEAMLRPKGKAVYRPRRQGHSDWATWIPDQFLQGVTDLFESDVENQVDLVSGSDTLPFIVRAMYYMNSTNKLLEPSVKKVTNRRGIFAYCDVNTSTQKRKDQTTLSLVKRLSEVEFLPTLEEMKAHLTKIGHFSKGDSVLENWTFTRSFIHKKTKCQAHQQGAMSFAMKEKFVDKLIRFEEVKMKSPLDMWDDFSILEQIPPTDGCYMVMLAEAMAIDRLFCCPETQALMKQYLKKMTPGDVEKMVEQSNDSSLISDRVMSLL